MSADRTPARRRPSAPGVGIEWSDADLAMLSRVTPADIKAARELWRSAAPLRFRLLLDAEVVNADAGPG